MTMTTFVKNVTGVIVNLNFTLYNPDHSVNDTDLMSGNITDGNGFSFPLFLVIASNLNQGDQIYLGGGVPAINETIPMSIAGYTRTVNFLNLTHSGEYMRYWWDQPTGMAVQARILLGGISANITMTSTTAFETSGAPPFNATTLIIVVGVVVVVVAGAAAVVHRRGKSQM
jgi:hypothetical protein